MWRWPWCYGYRHWRWTRLHSRHVSWGCRISQLRFWRGVRPPHTPARLPFGRGWYPVMLKDGILVVEPYLARQMRVQITCNTPLWSFYLTGSWIGRIRSIASSCQVLFCLDCIFPICTRNKFAPNPYLLGARRWWLNRENEFDHC